MDIKNKQLQQILLVIPTYNNADTISNVISKAAETGYDVLLVNDGCTDTTAKIVALLSVNRVSHTHNRGKGAAILTAAAWASKHNYTHIITIDADGQHEPSEVS